MPAQGNALGISEMDISPEGASQGGSLVEQALRHLDQQVDTPGEVRYPRAHQHLTASRSRLSRPPLVHPSKPPHHTGRGPLRRPPNFRGQRRRGTQTHKKHTLVQHSHRRGTGIVADFLRKSQPHHPFQIITITINTPPTESSRIVGEFFQNSPHPAGASPPSPQSTTTPPPPP